MKRLAIGLMLAASAPAAAAQAPAAAVLPGWVHFYDHGDGGVSSYNPDTLVRDGGLVRVWARWDQSRVEGAPFHEGRLHEEVDCAARTVRILAWAAYLADGSLLTREDSPLEPIAIEAGSLGEELWNQLCGAR